MRLAGLLRVGWVRPLGGGLFSGGHVGRDLLSGGRPFLSGRSLLFAGRRLFANPGDGGWALLGGRRRIQTAALAATLVATVGAVWTSSREPDEVGPAQAAAAGTGAAAGVRHEAECKVRYQVERDTGSDFEARVTVVNTGEGALDGWRMEFAYPGSQRLTDVPATVAQTGRRIAVRGRGELAAGRSATIVLRGAYRITNPLPLAFRLDGHICTAEVLGATVVPAASPSRTAKAKRKATSRKPSPAPSRTKSVRPAPSETPHVRPSTPPPATSTAPRRPSPLPSPPELQPRRAGGFSVAV